MDASRRAGETSLPTDYVAGTGKMMQVVTLLRRHGRGLHSSTSQLNFSSF
jgi:hypothetical protein